MKPDLATQFKHLITLAESLPTDNTYKSSSQLNVILQKYLKILDDVSCYSEAYKGSTNLFYGDITSIRDNIEQLLMADSVQKKNHAFETARHELECDLRALAILIKPAEEMTV